MGTNFYVITEKCEHCGRGNEDIHLGKSSMGWMFSFNYNSGKYYKNVPEMREWLRDKEIIDEYDRSVDPKDFWDLVEAKQDGMAGTEIDFDIDGYRFIDRVFS